MQISGGPSDFYKQIFGNEVMRGISLLTKNVIEMVSSPESASEVQDVYVGEGSQNTLYGSDPDENLGQAIADGARKRLMSRIYSFDSKILKEWSELNQKRLKEGLPPLNIYALTKEIESITNNSSLTDKEKEIKINEVRKRVGLEEGDMKHFFTERLEKIYDASRQELEKTLGVLQENAVRAEALYGKDSPQALAAARRLEVVGRVTQPLLQTLESNRGLYSRMYPPAGSCIKKVFGGIGSMFKGIVNTVGNFAKGIINPKNWLKPSFWLNVVAPIALHFIPGLGTIAAVALKWGTMIYRGVNAVKDLIQGKWEGLLSLGTSVLGKVVPGFQKIVNYGKIFYGGAKTVYDLTQGKLDSLYELGTMALGRVGQELKKVVAPVMDRVTEWVEKGKLIVKKLVVE